MSTAFCNAVVCVLQVRARKGQRLDCNEPACAYTKSEITPNNTAQIASEKMCIRDSWYGMVWLEKIIGAHEGVPAPVTPFAQLRAQLNDTDL